MKRILIVVSVLSLLCSLKLSYADEAARKQLAEKLLDVMKWEEQHVQFIEESKKLQAAMMKDIPAYQGKDIEKENDEQMDKMVTNTKALREEVATAYAEVFTEDELQGLINFYSSDIGQKYVAKTPQFTMRIMENGQKRTQAIMQEIMKQHGQKDQTNPQASNSNSGK